MADKVVRQLVTKDENGNQVTVNLGSDETKILVDGGTRTLEQKLNDVATKEDIDNLFNIVDGGTF